LEGVKMSGRLPKMHTKKADNMHTATGEPKNAISAHFWIIRINAGGKGIRHVVLGFHGKLHERNIQLDRKVLADLAMNNPTQPLRLYVDLVK
jgi:ribosomal protein L20